VWVWNQPISGSIRFRCRADQGESRFPGPVSQGPAFRDRRPRLDPATERELFHQIENLYSVDPALRTLSVLANTLGHDVAMRLSKWTRGGQFGFLFDNAEDTISFSRFQCFDFQRMSQYPELLEPLLFYILHRANAVIADREISSVFKAFFIDEAWVFLKNPSIQRYVVEALKTWRKHNAAMILSTQSLDELKRSDILDVIIESCSTKIFLANPDMDRELYRRQFHLNENEVALISNGLIPKQQFLIKTPELCEDRQSPRRSKKLLALYQRSLRQQETQRGVRDPRI
jgi:type IV secretory pathway VirB4 component